MLLFPVLFSFACAQKSYIAVQQILPPPTWSKVAIMPFSGDSKMAEMAEAILKSEIENKTHFELLKQNPQTSAVLDSETQAAEPNHLTSSEAQQKAKALNVDAYFQGNIVSEKRGKTFDAFTTIDLVEAKSGRVVASTHRPSGELLATSEEECVVAATERAAKDMVKAIGRLHIQKPIPANKKRP